MEISRELLAFLTTDEAKDALVENNTEKLYDLWSRASLDFTVDAKNLTELLYAAGINPLLYTSKVPWYFLNKYAGKLDSFTIPPNITVIERNAFYRTMLREIEIPSSVTFIGGFAFAKCSDLQQVIIPRGCKIDIEAFAATSIQKLILEDVDLRGISIFSSCDSLQHVIIRGNTPILKGSTFIDCANLTYVELPASLQRIERAVFLRCALKEINYMGTTSQWKKIRIDSRNDKLFWCKVSCTNGVLKFDGAVGEWIEV